MQKIARRRSGKRRGMPGKRQGGMTDATHLEARADRAFFLDIDGTLLRFADAPNEVAVDKALKKTLKRLYLRTDKAVALISGRSISQIDRLFAPLRFPVAGQHGLERRDGHGVLHRYAAPSPRLRAIKDRLMMLARRHIGLVLEDKGLTLAIHYRRVRPLAGYLNRLLRKLVAEADDLTLQRGKMVLELRPAEHDKGSTIMEFMAEEPFSGRIPVFIGDDATDEQGFAAVNRLHGHSVKVGAGPTAARWRFRDVDAVRAWLDCCANGLPGTR